MFAPDFTRNEKDYIQFPKDTDEWRKFFGDKKKGHPAPMNLYVVQELVRYYTKEGDRLLDPMGGSGTLMWAATERRKVILLELSQQFCGVMDDHLIDLITKYPGLSTIQILQGDCRSFLPIPCDHVIFSPPYSNIRGQKSKLEDDIHTSNVEYRQTEEESQLNVGNLSKFMYNQAMKQIYKKLGESIRSGGTMSIIIQDFVVKGVVQHIGKDAVTMCQDSGQFKLEDWHRRDAPLTFFRRLTEQQNPGQPTIDYEDITVLRRV